MNYKKIILFLISLFWFIFPFLLWGNTYLVGGDDTKLYYIFPQEFLKNYAFNIVSDNTLGGAMTGYASVSYFAPIFFIFSLVKLIPFISTQMLMYGLNFALGFLGFYKLMGLWVPVNNKKNFSITIIASLFYISSIYLVKTIYTHQLLSFYLVSVIPLTIFFFVKTIREKNFYSLIISVLIFSLFSSTVNSLPWFASVIIVILPLMIYEAFLEKKKFFQYLLFFIVLTFLLNFYWIFHFVYSYIHPSGLQSIFEYYSSNDFIKDNIRIITGVSQAYSPVNIVFNTMDNNFFNNFSFFTFLQSIFFLIIILASLLLRKVKTINYFNYVVILASFLLAWYLFSPNFGDWGRKLFIDLSFGIPFFTMFRNMYDKFALPLSLTYALLFGISLTILSHKIKKIFFSVLCVVLIIIIVANLVTSSQYLKKTIGESVKFSGMFTNDFTDLASYLRKLNDPSHVVWIPMNSPTYANIEDKNLINHYYSGLSPLRVLANMSDYTGRFGFITQSDLFLGDKLFSLLEYKKYDEFGEILQQRNAKYIIIDNQQLPLSLQSFMYGGEDKKLLRYQGDELKKILVGKKIKDFGNHYSLHFINSSFSNDKLYLTDDFKVFPQDFSQLHYKRISSYQYDIVINNLHDEKKLVFLDPFSKNWVLFLKSANHKRSYSEGKNLVVYNYANGWIINPKEIREKYDSDFYTLNQDGSINLHITLYFQPQKYNVLVYVISLTTLLTLCVILIIGGIKRVRRKNYAKSI